MGGEATQIYKNGDYYEASYASNGIKTYVKISLGTNGETITVVEGLYGMAIRNLWVKITWSNETLTNLTSLIDNFK